MRGNWKVVETVIGERRLYRAARLYGHNIVYRGGIWTTRDEAQKVASNLNHSESITEDVFEKADSYERLTLTQTADRIFSFFDGKDVEDDYINLTDVEVYGL